MISIRCMLGDESCARFGEEIADTYYEIERTGNDHKIKKKKKQTYGC